MCGCRYVSFHDSTAPELRLLPRTARGTLQDEGNQGSSSGHLGQPRKELGLRSQPVPAYVASDICIYIDISMSISISISIYMYVYICICVHMCNHLFIHFSLSKTM